RAAGRRRTDGFLAWASSRCDLARAFSHELGLAHGDRSVEGRVMRLKKDVAKLVSRERVCRVATVGRAGRPHVVPVVHVLTDGKLCFGSGRGAKKVENLRANPHATVTVDLYSHDWSNV